MVRWGIIGLGQIALRFAGALLSRSDATIAAVCSRSADKAQGFAQACGATAFTDLAAMLNAGIDIVYIASPHSLHCQHAVACLAAGKAVLIEKPIAATLQDAEVIADAARRSGRFAMEAMWTRFVPAVVEAKRLVDAGAIGKVTGFEASLSFPHAYDPQNRLFDPALGGGSLLDLGVYPISLALHFLGEPQAVTGMTVAAPNGVDLQAGIMMRHAQENTDAAMSRLSCGFDAEGSNDAVIIGTTGRIRLQRPLYAPAALIVSRPAGPLAATAIVPAERVAAMPAPSSEHKRAAWKQIMRPARQSSIRSYPYRGDGFPHQIDEVHRCLGAALSESPVMPLAASLGAMRIVEAVRRSTG